MLLKKLTVYDLFDEESLSYDLETQKKAYRKKDVEQITTALSHAFFGDTVLAHGKVELSFSDDGDCFVARDFKENTVVLQLGDKTIENENEVNDHFRSLLGMDKTHWDKFFLVKENELYKNSFENTEAYFADVLASLAIDEETTIAAAKRFKDKLADYKKQDELLDQIVPSFDQQRLTEDIASLSEEIARLEEYYSACEKAVFDGERAEEISAEYNLSSEEYDAMLTDREVIEGMRSRLQLSDAVSRRVDLVRRAVSVVAENDELKTVLTERKKELAEKIKETEVGERVLKKKQSAFSDLSADIQARYVALSELIAQNASSEADKKVLETVSNRFADLNERIGTLREKEKELDAQLKATEKDISVYSKKYQNAHLVQTFESLYAFNRTRMDNSSEKLAAITAEKGVSATEYVAMYHDAEKKKDELFRDYILADSLLKEIEAIDGKIGENNAAILSQQENLDALENAKETLVKYTEKCREKVEKADADILVLRTQKKYFDEIEALEYGERCPVCNMPVIDKIDNNEAIKKVETQLQKQYDDIASYRNILSEYTEKADEINLRLGSLRAKINTGKGYVDSLQQSKMIKIAQLGKIYTKAGVKDKDELAALLEETIRKVAQTSALANELKGVSSASVLAEENIARINACIKEITGEDGNGPLTQSRQKLVALEEKNALPAGSVSGEGEAEGDVYALLQEAIEKKKDIEKELCDVREEIYACQSREATVPEGEKDLTYGQLCISYAGKVYSAVIDEIRVKEEAKQTLVNEIVALIGVLKDKREGIEKAAAEVRYMENRFQNNLDYLETVKIDDLNDPTFANLSVTEQEKMILPVGEADSIRQTVDEYDRNLSMLASRCDTLRGLLPHDGKTLAEKKADLIETAQALQEKKATLAQLSGVFSLNNALIEKRSKLRGEAELYEYNYSFLTHLNDDSPVIVKDTVNHALLSMMPRFLTDCKGSGLIIREGKKTLNSITDELYSVVLVSLADAFRYVISGILDCPTLQRLVPIKANSVDDNVKEKINAYAKAHNIIVLYTK